VVAELPHAIVAFRSGNAWGIQPHVELDSEGLERLGRSVGAPPDVWSPLVGQLQGQASQVQASTFALLDDILL
jgi:hypothetical protein